MAQDHLQRAVAALQALDAEQLVSLYADSFTFEDPALGEVISGRTRLRAYFESLFALPGVSFSDADVFSSGDRGAARWTWSGTNPRTGRHFAIKGASLFEVGPDGITRETIFYDPSPAVGDADPSPADGPPDAIRPDAAPPSDATRPALRAS